MDKQAPAAHEIAHNTEQAAQGSNEVYRQISSVTEYVGETTKLTRTLLDLPQTRGWNAEVFKTEMGTMVQSLRSQA